MRTTPYNDILEQARQLPVSDQVELAEALLHNVHAAMLEAAEPGNGQNLVPLNGLSEEELQALANAVVSPEHQVQLQTLLAENRNRDLTAPQTEVLDSLLDEIDQVALLKARALYTLQLRQ